MTEQVNDYRDPQSPGTALTSGDAPVTLNANLSPNEALATAQMMLKHGNVSRAAAAEALKPWGIELPALDNRNRAIEQFDEHFGAPVADPHVDVTSIVGAVPSDELPGVVEAAREFMTKAGLGDMLGNRITSQLFEDRVAQSKMSRDQVAEYDAAQDRTLDAVKSSGGAKAVRDKAEAFLRQTGGQMSQFMLEGHLSANVLVALAQAGERRELRTKLGG